MNREQNFMNDHTGTLRTMIHQREDGPCVCAECRALKYAINELSGREAVAADWKMEVKPSASDAEILAYLDELLDVQGRLMFAKGNAPEPLGEVFGVAILDFMRLHGMRVREIIRAAPSAKGVAP